MEICDRIKMIVRQIENDSLADIGTDHGYIPIYAQETLNLSKIIACDVNKMPLENCRKNLERYGILELVETRLGNGIEEIGFGEVGSVTIGGMGGNLIIDILEKDLELTKSFQQIILQPQSSVEQVRRFVHKIGFSIKNEEMIFEDEFYYNILNCVNREEEKYSDFEYAFGKLLVKKSDKTLKDFLSEEMEKLERIKSKIEANLKNIDLSKEKLEKLDKKIGEIKKYLY